MLLEGREASIARLSSLSDIKGRKKKKKKERAKGDALFGTMKERGRENGVRIIPEELLNQISCPKTCKVYQTAKAQIQSNSRPLASTMDVAGSAIKCIKLFHALD